MIILPGKSMHSTLKGSDGAVHPSYSNNCLKVKYPLHIFDSYVQPITQQCESITVWKAPL